MCTVAVRWRPGDAAAVLAVRDELTSRAFDDPGEWWPDHPGVVGGRDRAAGGSWCVSDVASGRTALVLNRTDRPTGSPSRGVLPLAAVTHGRDWPAHIAHAGMASFILVLVTPSALLAWQWDGTELTGADLPPGLHVVTPRGVDPDDARTRRVTPLLAGDGWREVVTAERPSDAEDALLVRHELDGAVYASVFAQLIDAVPGRVHVAQSRTPQDPATWTEREWTRPRR